MSEKSYGISIGGSVGAAIAVVLSYGLNKSIAWATVHGLLGWIYVIYHYFKYLNNN